MHLHVREQKAWSQDADACLAEFRGMQNIASRCSSEVARHGVRLKPCIIALGDGPIVPPRAEIDFVIVPRSEENVLPPDIGRYLVLVR